MFVLSFNAVPLSVASGCRLLASDGSVPRLDKKSLGRATGYMMYLMMYHARVTYDV